jgi:hypothetical protein
VGRELLSPFWVLKPEVVERLLCFSLPRRRRDVSAETCATLLFHYIRLETTREKQPSNSEYGIQPNRYRTVCKYAETSSLTHGAHDGVAVPDWSAGTNANQGGG